MADTIVLYPSAGRGHIVPMVELGKQIVTHHPNFSITIIIPFAPPSNSSFIANCSANNPSINFLHLPSISLDSLITTKHTPTLQFELTTLNNPNLQKLLSKLSESCKLKAFVIDFFCFSALEVSASLNIPTYYFMPCGANGLAAFLYLPTIHENTTTSLKDLDIFINVPGLPPIEAYNMPMLMLDRNQKFYTYFKEAATQMPKSAGFIVNTVEGLEQRSLKAIREGHCTPGKSMPPVYCIGPLIGTSDDQEKHACLSWLDSQPKQSVVFLSFGSGGKFFAKQLIEMATGLEQSGVRFLWVVRPPYDLSMETGEPSLESLLPDGFLERTKCRGMVVKSWAPQVQVLNHEAIGGFVTHCGWNSILEAICAGVPMLAWPLYAEQKVNRAFLVEELEVAFSVNELRNGSVSSDNVKEGVATLMKSEKRKEIRERMIELREQIIAARNENGSSREALAKLAESF